MVLSCELKVHLPADCPSCCEITREKFLESMLCPVQARQDQLAVELANFPKGQAPARVRARQQLSDQLQKVRASVREVTAWVRGMPEKSVRFFSFWKTVGDVDTHFGSYYDKELHVVALHGEEAGGEGEGRLCCVVEVGGACGAPLGARTISDSQADKEIEMMERRAGPR